MWHAASPPSRRGERHDGLAGQMHMSAGGQGTRPLNLLAVQRQFRAWLTSEAPEVAIGFGERARSGLGVYLNNYRAQLLACLSASYPVLRVWIGDTAFEGAAATHIDNVPPHAWTLDAYGVDFADTLQSLYPADPEIAELARLEQALAAAFVGPDASVGDAHSVAAPHFADIDWDTAHIQFVPTLTLLPATTNAAAIWSALSAGDTPPAAARLPEPAHLLIWRQDLTPRFRAEMPGEASALAHLQDPGETFGSLCATLVERVGQERAPTLAGSFLGQWLSDGLIAGVRS